MKHKTLILIPLILLLLLLVFWGIRSAMAEPQIITVYKEVDLREDSVVIILQDPPITPMAIYNYWLKNRTLIKEQYNIAFSENTKIINFMSPNYEEPKHIENQYCFSKYIKDKTKQCINKDNIILGTIYNDQDEDIALFFRNPFCMTYVDINGKLLLQDDKCFK